MTLFIIAITGIANGLPTTVTPLLYADDLAFMITEKDLDKMGHKLQEAMNTITKTAEAQGLALSTKETNVIHFFRLRKHHNKPILKLKDTKLEYKDSFKFLGIVLDRKLTYNSHIKELEKKIQQLMN